MAFLVPPILHHFVPTICTSIFYVFLFYLFCIFLIFCLLHFPQLIVYDDDSPKVRYFVCDIFELNWNSYSPIFQLSSSFYFYNVSLLTETSLESSQPFIYRFSSECEQWNFWCRPMWTQLRFRSNGALLEKLINHRPTDPFLPSRHNHHHHRYNFSASRESCFLSNFRFLAFNILADIALPNFHFFLQCAPRLKFFPVRCRFSTFFSTFGYFLLSSGFFSPFTDFTLFLHNLFWLNFTFFSQAILSFCHFQYVIIQTYRSKYIVFPIFG